MINKEKYCFECIHCYRENNQMNCSLKGIRTNYFEIECDSWEKDLNTEDILRRLPSDLMKLFYILSFSCGVPFSLAKETGKAFFWELKTEKEKSEVLGKLINKWNIAKDRLKFRGEENGD